MELQTQCWLWPGITNKKGYGITTVSNPRRTVRVHRAAYEVLVGPIPEGMELDHLCSVRNCYRPEHLEPITHTENVRRAVEKRSACGAGHPWIKENIYIGSNGSRCCRSCKRIAHIREYQKRKNHGEI